MRHAEAGYQHQIGKFTRNGELSWRGKHSVTRNGNLYPTHPMGPIAWWMDINRGDQLDYMVSMSSAAGFLSQQAAERFGADSEWAKTDFALGDVNVSLIKTVRGRTITLYHDTNLPRPYDLILRVQGTKGIFQGYPDRIYIHKEEPRRMEIPERRDGAAGQRPSSRRRRHYKEPEWESTDKYVKEYDHPLWKREGHNAVHYGHGGGDYMELYQLIAALKCGREPDMDVYDAACWSAISAVSEKSVAKGSEPIEFPDFTKGKWKTRPPLEIA